MFYIDLFFFVWFIYLSSEFFLLYSFLCTKHESYVQNLCNHILRFDIFPTINNKKKWLFHPVFGRCYCCCWRCNFLFVCSEFSFFGFFCFQSIIFTMILFLSLFGYLDYIRAIFSNIATECMILVYPDFFFVSKSIFSEK